MGLPIGMTAPNFSLGGLSHETVTLEALAAARKPVLLLFTSPHCGPCRALMPEIGRWQREHADRLTIALVSEGTADENRKDGAAHGVVRIMLQEKREIADAYKAWGTPAAVLIDVDGAIASPLAQGADAIRALVGQSAGGSLRPAPETAVPAQRGNGHFPLQVAATAGDLAPALMLRDLDGKSATLNDLNDMALLLFWNPSCGFCQRMLPDLRQWEVNPPTGSPPLLLISTGTVDENRAMGLRSRILLDQNSHVGATFGATGTPMAVLLDAQGRVASRVVAGAQAVFALARPSG
jgi:thiol-disulfide isomerase/thioredoxin